MPGAVPVSAETLPLRDIHLPAAVSWWPPAPGWWLLLSLTLLLLATGWWLRRRYRRGRYRRLALRRLQLVEQRFRDDADALRLVQDLSRLLRQAALCHFPAGECAGLVGADWLRFLDRQLADRPFSGAAGRCLGTAPYRQQSGEIDAEALLGACRRWLRRLPLAPATSGGGR